MGKKIKHTTRTTHISYKIFDKDFVAIQFCPYKPIYVGFIVLELKKWFMCDFIEKHFDAEVLFTDTDSFTYQIKSEDVYEEFVWTLVTFQKNQCFLM